MKGLLSEHQFMGHLNGAKASSSILGACEAFHKQKNYSSLFYLLPSQVTAEKKIPRV